MRQNLLKLISFLTLIILLLPSALSEEAINDPYLSLKNHVTAESIKTRTEFTSYTDKKIEEMNTQVTTKVQGYIDENFKILDDRTRLMFLKAQIQISIAVILCIIIANAIWYLIKRSIEKIRKPIPKTIKDNLTANKYGLISEKYQETIHQEDKTIIKPTAYQDLTETSINTPQVKIIEELLREKKEKERLQAEKEKQKIEIENAKKKEEIKKLLEKKRNKTKNLDKKIGELTQQIIPTNLDEPPQPPTILNTLIK
jgi:hypothetical protein